MRRFDEICTRQFQHKEVQDLHSYSRQRNNSTNSTPDVEGKYLNVEKWGIKDTVKIHPRFIKHKKVIESGII
jgi:hypothetical protein